jgi:hypothetical protein
MGDYTSFAGIEGVREGNVHFCGEQTDLDFQGFMEGAVRSGERLAAHWPSLQIDLYRPPMWHKSVLRKARFPAHVECPEQGRNRLPSGHAGSIHSTRNPRWHWMAPR